MILARIDASHRGRTTGGGALLVVLWCIAVMVTVLILTATTVEQEMLGISARIAQDRARQISLAGLALAENPAVRPGDPILNRDLGNGERLQVLVTSEEARLNLNLWVADDRQPVLIQLFRLWGLERRDAERLVHALADWVDPDTLRRAQGAEVRDYDVPNRPYNRPFLNLDEVRLVRDFGLLERVRPDWRTRLSVRGQAALDLMEAPADLIVAVSGSSPETVALWIRDRWGRDGVRYTDDDPLPPSLEEALQRLGVPAANDASGWMTIQGPTRRIQSVGVKGDYVHVTSIVTSGGGPAEGGVPPEGGGQLGAGGPGNLLWMEERSGTVASLDRSASTGSRF